MKNTLFERVKQRLRTSRSLRILVVVAASGLVVAGVSSQTGTSASATVHATTTTVPIPPPPGPCCSTRPAGPITVSFVGLHNGERVANKGTTEEFQVTFSNYSEAQFPPIAPVVAAEHYSGAPGYEKITAGELERYNPKTHSWTKLALGEGTGTDFMSSGEAAKFRLPPGRHVSVRYRMTLSSTDAPGRLKIDALAVPDANNASVGNQPSLGNIAVVVRVVKPG